MSDLEQFARLVKSMRAAQGEYFRTRTPLALNVSRDYERRVDKAVGEILGPPTPDLFVDAK